MTRLDDLLARFPLPGWQRPGWIVGLLFSAAVVWASQAELEQVAVAAGTVVPQGQVRAVQHLEGGIVTDILVRDGEEVAEGQPLVRLDLGNGGIDPDQIQVRLDGLRLERARLSAEVEGGEPDVPHDAEARQPALAAAERVAHGWRQQEHVSNIAVLREQSTQRRLDLQALQTRLDSLQRNLTLAREQHEIVARLAAANLLPRIQELGLEREVEQLEGEIASLRVAIPLAEAALLEAEERQQQEVNRFLKTAAERLREVELDIAHQQGLLERATNQARRTEVLSPIHGIVQNMRVNTIGGVVNPGEPILEVVPVNEKLVVEARLSPQDIGRIRVDQPVTVKVSTYDYMRYGGLAGRVSRIAADSSVDREGRHYFRIVVETESDRLMVGGAAYPISAGMETLVDIRTGTRSVAEYLVQPVLKLRNEAFRDP